MNIRMQINDRSALLRYCNVWNWFQKLSFQVNLDEATDPWGVKVICIFSKENQEMIFCHKIFQNFEENQNKFLLLEKFNFQIFKVICIFSKVNQRKIFVVRKFPKYPQKKIRRWCLLSIFLQIFLTRNQKKILLSENFQVFSKYY